MHKVIYVSVQWALYPHLYFDFMNRQEPQRLLLFACLFNASLHIIYIYTVWHALRWYLTIHISTSIPLEWSAVRMKKKKKAAGETYEIFRWNGSQYCLTCSYSVALIPHLIKCISHSIAKNPYVSLLIVLNSYSLSLHIHGGRN